MFISFLIVFVNYNNHPGEDRIHNYTAYPKWDEPCNTWIPPKMNKTYCQHICTYIHPLFFGGESFKENLLPENRPDNHGSSFVKGRFLGFFRTTFHWNLLLCRNTPSWNPIASQKDNRWSDSGREGRIQFVFFWKVFLGGPKMIALGNLH